MTKYVDQAFWENSLEKPDWYSILKDDFKRLENLAKHEKDYTKHKQIKQEAYRLIEAAIRDNRLPIAKSGDNYDKDRKPVDTIVIHHTKNQPGMTLERLNAMHTILLYGKYYAGQTNQKDPIWSGHFYKEKQIFWGYHWFIRSDGSIERILKDEYIGWHAGNWDINTRGVGICIDDDLTNKEPREIVIKSIAKLIRDYYQNVKPNNIVGHCDINKKTVCPGHLFHESWRQKIVNLIEIGEEK